METGFLDFLFGERCMFGRLWAGPFGLQKGALRSGACGASCHAAFSCGGEHAALQQDV